MQIYNLMFVSCNAPKLYEFQENRIVFIIGVLFCVIKYLAPQKVSELMSREESKHLFSRLSTYGFNHIWHLSWNNTIVLDMLSDFV